MKKNNTTQKAVAIGASMAVLGATTFLLFGPEGKKHRKDLKSWMLKMKGEVMEKMEKAKDLSAETYKEIVNGVEAKYKAMKHVDGDMLAKEVADLKKNWRAVSKMAKSKPTKKAKK